MLTVQIEKSKWLRGIGDAVLREEVTGKMCCIGFLAQALGCTAKEITDAPRLDDFKSDDKEAEERRILFIENHEDTLDTAYNVNDSTVISDEERIQELIGIGHNMGVDFIFTD